METPRTVPLSSFRTAFSLLFHQIPFGWFQQRNLNWISRPYRRPRLFIDCPCSGGAVQYPSSLRRHDTMASTAFSMATSMPFSLMKNVVPYFPDKRVQKTFGSANFTPCIHTYDDDDNDELNIILFGLNRLKQKREEKKYPDIVHVVCKREKEYLDWYPHKKLDRISRQLCSQQLRPYRPKKYTK